MKKLLARFITLLLLPCLIMDPAFASGSHAQPNPLPQSRLFEQEALVSALTQWRLSLQPTITEKIYSIAGNFLTLIIFPPGAGPKVDTPPRVVVADKIDVKALGVPGIIDVSKSLDKTAAILAADPDILIVRSTVVRANLMRQLPNLKVVIRAGHGTDKIDMAFTAEHGIRVYKTGGSEEPVAALTMRMLARAVQGNAVYGHDQVPDSFYSIPDWQAALESKIARAGFSEAETSNVRSKAQQLFMPIDAATIQSLKGKTIGIFGFGNIAQQIAKNAKELGMNVWVYSPSLSKDPKLATQFGYQVVTPDDIYRRANFLALMMGLNKDGPKRNVGMINEYAAELLIENSRFEALINTDRKELVDESAIVHLLNELPRAKYIADDVPDDAYLKANTLYTPHIGASTANGESQVAAATARVLAPIYRELAAAPSAGPATPPGEKTDTQHRGLKPRASRSHMEEMVGHALLGGSGNLRETRHYHETVPQTIPELLQKQVDRYAAKTFLRVPDMDGTYHDIPFKTFQANVKWFGQLFLLRGARQKDRIAFLSANSPAYAEAAMGAWDMGATVVPLSTRSSLDQLDYMLRDSNATRLVVSRQTLDVARALKQRIGLHHLQIIILDKLPREELQQDETSLDFWQPKTKILSEKIDIHPQDVALILYTSGSTKRPKGVPLTHQNLLFNREASAKAWEGQFTDRDTTLGWLPFFHVMGLPFEFLGNLYTGATYAFPRLKPGPPTADQLLAALRETGATVFYTVPKMLEDMRRMAEKDPTVLDSLRKLKWIMSGGASLPRDIGEYFQKNGVNVIQGEGMTEVAGALFLGDPRSHDWQTLHPLPGIHERFVPVEGLSPDRGLELVLENSPTALTSYLNDLQSTQAAFRKPGQFYTRDLFLPSPSGSGYIYAGRADDAFKLSTGEHINPLPIEQEVQGVFIERAVVVGRDKPFNLLLIKPHYEAFKGKQWMEIDAALWAIVERVNQSLPDYAQLRHQNVLILAPGEDIPSTTKGNPDRKATESLYKNLIQARYGQKAAERKRSAVIQGVLSSTANLRHSMEAIPLKDLTLAFIRSFMDASNVTVTGNHLTVPELVSVARNLALVELTSDPATRARVDASVDVLAKQVANGETVYGGTTGFGGSANVRTQQVEKLQAELIRHQQSGLNEGFHALPRDVVRGAMLIRANSNIKGYSGLRWLVIQNLVTLLNKGITPLVAKRGSITASGDLMPLAQIMAVLIGEPTARALYQGKVISAPEALRIAGLEPVFLQVKEGLAFINGTSMANSLAALNLYDANILALLSEALTAMSVEALLGTNQSYDPLIHALKNHREQQEVAADILHLLKGSKLANDELDGVNRTRPGHMAQDRYSLRTSPQWLGPQMRTLKAALRAITEEMNSVNDNPLVDPDTNRILHTGNFQGKSVADAMEQTRLALQSMGHLMYAQHTKLINKDYNNGLTADLGGSDSAVDMGLKGIDINMAGYFSDLSNLANPVANHGVEAELYNQDVNSLGLLSARRTQEAIEVLQIMMAARLYELAQAIDLRNIERAYITATKEAIESTVQETIATLKEPPNLTFTLEMISQLIRQAEQQPSLRYARTASERYKTLFDSLQPTLYETTKRLGVNDGFTELFQSTLAKHLDQLLPAAKERALQQGAGHLMGHTRPLYEFVRRNLAIRFEQADQTSGPQLQKIFDAIRIGEIARPLLDALYTSNSSDPEVSSNPAPPARTPDKTIDPGIAGNGQGGHMRAEHLEFHKRGEFEKVIHSIVRWLRLRRIDIMEVPGPNGSAWYNFRPLFPQTSSRETPVPGRPGEKVLNVSRDATIRRETDGIVVIIDPTFKENHAGRSGMVMARDERMARHELAELRFIALWAVKKKFAVFSDLEIGLLGKKIRDWLNDPEENESTRSRRNDQFQTAMDKAHAFGLAAEESEHAPVFPPGYPEHTRVFGGIPTWAADREIETEGERDGIISSRGNDPQTPAPPEQDTPKVFHYQDIWQEFPNQVNAAQRAVELAVQGATILGIPKDDVQSISGQVALYWKEYRERIVSFETHGFPKSPWYTLKPISDATRLTFHVTADPDYVLPALPGGSSFRGPDEGKTLKRHHIVGNDDDRTGIFGTMGGHHQNGKNDRPLSSLAATLPANLNGEWKGPMDITVTFSHYYAHVRRMFPQYGAAIKEFILEPLRKAAVAGTLNPLRTTEFLQGLFEEAATEAANYTRALMQGYFKIVGGKMTSDLLAKAA